MESFLQDGTSGPWRRRGGGDERVDEFEERRMEIDGRRAAVEFLDAGTRGDPIGHIRPVHRRLAAGERRRPARPDRPHGHEVGRRDQLNEARDLGLRHRREPHAVAEHRAVGPDQGARGTDALATVSAPPVDGDQGALLEWRPRPLDAAGAQAEQEEQEADGAPAHGRLREAGGDSGGDSGSEQGTAKCGYEK